MESSRERVLKAVNHVEPEVVPVHVMGFEDMGRWLERFARRTISNCGTGWAWTSRAAGWSISATRRRQDLELGDRANREGSRVRATARRAAASPWRRPPPLPRWRASTGPIRTISITRPRRGPVLPAGRQGALGKDPVCAGGRRAESHRQRAQRWPLDPAHLLRL